MCHIQYIPPSDSPQMSPVRPANFRHRKQCQCVETLCTGSLPDSNSNVWICNKRWTRWKQDDSSFYQRFLKASCRCTRKQLTKSKNNELKISFSLYKVTFIPTFTRSCSAKRWAKKRVTSISLSWHSVYKPDQTLFCFKTNLRTKPSTKL